MIDIRQLVELHTADMLSWATHKVSDAELAKDLVQDTFLAATEKQHSFQGKSTPKTWLFSILNYKIIDFYRSRINQPLSLDKDNLTAFFTSSGEWDENMKPKDWQEDDSSPLDNKDFQIILKQCLDALPDKWNTCVKLKYLMNKNGDEICQELGIKPTNFWQMMHRAKLNLRNCLENNWFLNE
jgi:RNA polymerase sigma-70 factor (TIGR02943 family)